MTRTHILGIAIAGVAVLGLAGAAPALAQGNAYKIGVVDCNAVFDDYQKQIDLSDETERDREKLNKDYDARFEALKKKQEELIENKDKYAPEEAKEKAVLLDRELLDLKTQLQRDEADLQRKIKKLSDLVAEEIMAAVQVVGERENYHLIFASSASRRDMDSKLPALLYNSASVDLTQRIVDYLNEKYAKDKD